MNVPAENKLRRTVSQENEIQFFIDIARKLYHFLRETKYATDDYFKTFPRECCYYSTFVTALVLERLEYDTIFWILGYRQITGAHVWCECEKYTIDLTSGQYSDSTSEYLIYKTNFNSNEFHSSFQAIDKGKFDARFRQNTVYSDLRKIVDSFFLAN